MIISRGLVWALLSFTLMVMIQPALAQQSPATMLPLLATPAATISSSTPTAASPAIAPPLAPLAAHLGQTIQTLVTGSSPSDKDDDNGSQIIDGVTSQILDGIARGIDALKAHDTIIPNTMAALPDFDAWAANQFSDPHRQALWSAIGNDALIIIGVPLLTGLALSLFLWPVRVNLRRHEPPTTPGRVGLVISLFFLRVVPVLVFLTLSLILLDQNEPHRLPRFIILDIIYALTLAYSIQQIARGILSPTSGHLRLFTFSTPRAQGAYRWVSLFTYLIVYGYFFIDITQALRMPGSNITFLQNLFALIVTILTIIVIFRTKPDIAAVIRGKHARENSESYTSALRIWLSRHWHRLATIYLVISLIVTLLGIEDGFALLLRGTILTIAILVVSRALFTVIDYWANTSNRSGQIHRQFLAFLLRPLIWLGTALSIATLWGFKTNHLLATAVGQKILAPISTISVTLFVLTILYEMLNASIERHLNHGDGHNNAPSASARARTLLPMVRTSVFILFCGIGALIGLSSVGINIGPLLAGAGVLGVAVGFGSQTLVKDFLTGLFIVVENTITVGDVVKVGDDEGVVEALSIRTLRLRATNGSLHIIPFSDVVRITNHTRGFAYAVIDISVSYDSDLERVMQVMRDVGTQVQADPIYKRVIMEPIEVLGVETLGDSGITIRARMRTRPGKQWDVKRLLLLQIKQQFDKENIEIPYPTVTQIAKAVTAKESSP